jgi:hypothetical protein
MNSKSAASGPPSIRSIYRASPGKTPKEKPSEIETKFGTAAAGRARLDALGID